MPVAIYYHPDAYSIDGPKLMGRNAAGLSFLRSYIKNFQDDNFWIYAEEVKHVDHFIAFLKNEGISRSSFSSSFFSRFDPSFTLFSFIPGISV